mmetsp:Transcript_16055/g.55868  ORF Transcript_16055/g.55868 Transcript_16055/m.55868 type:complete len:230 (-) Transcript_16055:2139-2828(-)
MRIAACEVRSTAPWQRCTSCARSCSDMPSMWPNHSEHASFAASLFTGQVRWMLPRSTSASQASLCKNSRASLQLVLMWSSQPARFGTSSCNLDRVVVSAALCSASVVVVAGNSTTGLIITTSAFFEEVNQTTGVVVVSGFRSTQLPNGVVVGPSVSWGAGFVVVTSFVVVPGPVVVSPGPAKGFGKLGKDNEGRPKLGNCTGPLGGFAKFVVVVHSELGAGAGPCGVIR